MKETWKPVVGYEGIYEVSSFGRVKTVDHFVDYKQSGKYKTKMHVKEKIRKLQNIKGYLTVQLLSKGSSRTALVHRLVANAFIHNPLNKPDVNHIDNNTSNNNVTNLEWCTEKENNYHCIRSGRHVSKKGSSHPHSKLSEKDIPIIKQLRKDGLSYRLIGEHYGVHLGTIFYAIKLGWKHVK